VDAHDAHDDLQHLLQDLSGGGELHESNTELIWGSSAATGTVAARAASSSSDSVLQSESPLVRGAATAACAGAPAGPRTASKV
jgi:hypothetical protein